MIRADVKAGQIPGCPRFKGVGHVRVHQHRPVKGRVKTISVKREGNRWYVVLECDDVPAELLPPKRLDFHHKTARALVRDHDVIAHGRLNIAGMTKSPAPQPAPGRGDAFLRNGAAAKAGLNRGILDAGRGQFLVIRVDPRNTSRTCPTSLGGCGHIGKENRVIQAMFPCTACGLTANADHVRASNVFDRAGRAHCDVTQSTMQEARRFCGGRSHGMKPLPKSPRFCRTS